MKTTLFSLPNIFALPSQRDPLMLVELSSFELPLTIDDLGIGYDFDMVSIVPALCWQFRIVVLILNRDPEPWIPENTIFAQYLAYRIDSDREVRHYLFLAAETGDCAGGIA
jgi:hypothetical protein